jgi:hypothetical protein
MKSGTRLTGSVSFSSSMNQAAWRARTRFELCAISWRSEAAAAPWTEKRAEERLRDRWGSDRRADSTAPLSRRKAVSVSTPRIGRRFPRVARRKKKIPALALRWTRYSREPKSAEPMRTIVLPSAIAASRSPLMPIESSRRGARVGGEAVADSRRPRKRPARDGRVVGERGDRHQAVHADDDFPSAASRRRGASSGSAPDFAGSSPALTWSRTGRVLPELGGGAVQDPEQLHAVHALDPSKCRAASRALLDCRCPMSSQATAAAVCARFSTPSWTRFSPTARRP